MTGYFLMFLVYGAGIFAFCAIILTGLVRIYAFKKRLKELEKQKRENK